MNEGKNKTPYEIRLDLLYLAREILMTKMECRKSISDPPNGTMDPPTTEEIVKEAAKLNQFISVDPNKRK